MSEPTPRPDEKILTSLLLAVVILAAVALMKEGPQYDNVLESWRFFNTAFFTGALVGFLGWTQTFRIVPTLSYQRYQITKPAAEALMKQKSVRMEISRGALGFELITRFEPNP